MTFEALYREFRTQEVRRRRALGLAGRLREREERMRAVAALNEALASWPPPQALRVDPAAAARWGKKP